MGLGAELLGKKLAGGCLLFFVQSVTLSFCESNRAVSSAVERVPYKHDATGSNPVLPIHRMNQIRGFGELAPLSWLGANLARYWGVQWVGW